MPISYVFKDSKTTDNVAKALLFVAKFSKNQALVKFSDSSVSVIWGGSPKTYFIHAESTAWDMFKNRQQLERQLLYGIDHCTVIAVDPTILGKTLKGGTQDRNVTLTVAKPNRLVVNAETADNSKRTIVHTIRCEFKTLEDYKSMLIEEIEQTVCRYDTKSYLDNVHRFKHIIDSFVRLGTPRIYLWSKQSDQGNDLTINTRTQGAIVNVSLSDLENGYEDTEKDQFNPGRQEAGVNVDTKKLSSFLASPLIQRKSKVSFEVEHNKCLKIAVDNEVQGEKSYQSLLLLHSLTS